MTALQFPFGVFLLSLLLNLSGQIRAADNPTVELQFVIDDSRGQPLPCRVHVFDAANKPVQAAGLPFWKDHFSCSGRVTLQLSAGKYKYEIERGPEHQRIAGTVELMMGRAHSVHVRLDRIAELKRLGWYAGDLHIHRPVADIELLMRAEDLHIAPVITWWNNRNLWMGRDKPKEVLTRFDGERFYHVMAGEDERGGGALLYFHLDDVLPIADAQREDPSPLQFATAARKKSPPVWIDIEKPFWWDVPTWLASGQTSSIGIANNHMCRSSVYASEAWGRPRDERRLPPPLGNGQWTQEIYYHLLNCGLRVPPSAGSASGVLPNPVGYNRVYVQVKGELTWDKWWAGLKAGRCFVTNGPLLLCRTDGELPGFVFRGDVGKEVEIPLEMTLTSNDRVRQIEIVHNGVVVQKIAVDDVLSQSRRATLKVKESGWFLVRAIAERSDTYRFASTAPFYVEIGKDGRHVSRRSVKFFHEWVDERILRLEKALPDETRRRAVVEPHEQARKFWQELAGKANAD